MDGKNRAVEPMVRISPTTTSQRQGRLREEGSEGSWRQDPRVDEQKRHKRPSSPGERAPDGEAHTEDGWHANGAIVRGQLTFLSREICSLRGVRAMGDGLRTIPKGVESPPVPKADSARWAATPVGREQKSAEATVAVCRPDRRREAKGRTSWTKEEP